MRHNGTGNVAWHPHQKLWNQRLVRALRASLGPLARPAIVAVIWLDSLLLAARALLARARSGVAVQRSPSSASRRPSVLYLDCGLHKRGEQIRWMHRWFGERYDLRIIGFEASGEHFADVTTALADLAGVEIRQLALVGPDHEGDEVRLYKGSEDGKDDSLLAPARGAFETVPAGRLSDVLSEAGCDPAGTAIIVRMNIEGAEQFVIADLLAAGVEVDGFYGMWDDLSKLDPAADAEFRARLRDAGISTTTFNDRDMPHLGPRPSSRAGRALRDLRRSAFAMRRFAIRFDVETSIRRGTRRVARSGQRKTRAGSVPTQP